MLRRVHNALKHFSNEYIGVSGENDMISSRDGVTKHMTHNVSYESNVTTEMELNCINVFPMERHKENRYLLFMAISNEVLGLLNFEGIPKAAKHTKAIVKLDHQY